MPHSSGGGSHSSGSHSGSSSSSGSSGSSRSAAAIRKTPFDNCHTFVNYSSGQPEYRYSDLDHLDPDKLTVPILKIFWVVIQVILLIITFCSVHIPHRVSAGHTAADIVVVDTLGVINIEKLLPELEEFQEVTGVTPVVYTISNKTWNAHYTTLEAFAYDLYVNTLPDETYWLLVYSTAEESDGWNDWYWEGMQGNDTDSVLTEQICDKFGAVVQRVLLAEADNGDVGRAFKEAFDKITPMTSKVSLKAPVWPLIIADLAVTASFFTVIRAVRKRNDTMRNLVPVPETSIEQKRAIEDRCDWCGGIYVVGTVQKCPYCGGTLNPHYSDGTRIN